MAKQYGHLDREFLIATLFAALFMIMGVASICFGLYFFNDIQSIRKNGEKTEGIIIRFERRGTRTVNMKGMFVVPIVQFQTKAGQSIVVEGKCDNTSVLQNLCKTGEHVEVIYDPKKPQHAVINTFAELWFVPLLSWVIGGGFVLGPPFTIWRHYRGRKRIELYAAKTRSV